MLSKLQQKGRVFQIHYSGYRRKRVMIIQFSTQYSNKKSVRMQKVRRQWELINNSFIIQIFAPTFYRNVTTREKSNFSWCKIHDINFASIELQLHLHLQMDISFSHCCILRVSVQHMCTLFHCILYFSWNSQVKSETEFPQCSNVTVLRVNHKIWFWIIDRQNIFINNVFFVHQWYICSTLCWQASNINISCRRT